MEGFRVNRAEGNRLFPQQMPATLRPGMRLWRNNDMEFERVLSRPSSERKIPVTMRLSATPTGFRLTAQTVPNLRRTIDCPHQMAEKPQRENIRACSYWARGHALTSVERVQLADGFSFFVPNSQLAELRRRLSGTAMHPVTMQHDDAPAPSTISTLYNIANQQAAAFYHETEPTAYELKGGKAALLMQCRHCLRYSLGYCVRRGGGGHHGMSRSSCDWATGGDSVLSSIAKTVR